MAAASFHRNLVAGVVGLGVGEQHARALSGLERVGRVVLHDLDPVRAAEVSRRVPKGEVATSIDEVIGNPAVDLVCIASFDDAHFDQARAALAAGQHVFVEKPLCRTLDEVAEIRRLWRAAGGRLRLGCNLVLRAAPLYAWLRAEVRAQRFGELYAFDGDYLYGRLSKVTEGWRAGVDDYSVMQGGGIHLIDLMLWICGQRPATVSALGNRISSAGSAYRYDDFRAALLRFDSGLVGRITANFGCVHAHQHVMRVFGTRRTFIYDDAGARVHGSRDPQLASERVPHAPLPESKGILIPGFVETLLAPANSGDEETIFDGICVAIACDRAALSGQIETIEYL